MTAIAQVGRRRPGVRRTIGAILAIATSVLVGCSKDPGSRVAFCREARQVPDLSATLGGFSQADRAELRKRLTTAGRAYGRLRDAAPEEIRGDAAKVVGIVEAVLDAVRAHPGDPEAATAEVRRVMADAPDIAKASAAVTTFASRHCGVELDPTASAPTTRPPATTAPSATTTPTTTPATKPGA